MNIKDDIGNVYVVCFETIPKKIENFRKSTQPLVKIDFTDYGIEAIGYFEKDEIGQTSFCLHLDFKTGEHWVFGNIKNHSPYMYGFVKTSQMANNCIGKESTPAFKQIEAFFNN
jgi:hypothetical protein